MAVGHEEEVLRDFLSPEQYAEWVAVRMALNVMTKEMIAPGGKEGGKSSPFANFRIFVLRIPYGLEQEAARQINEKAVPFIPEVCAKRTVPEGFMLAYAPMHIRERQKGENGVGTRHLTSLLPNVLFLFAEEANAKELVTLGLAKRGVRGRQDAVSLVRLRFMYDHTAQCPDGTNPLLRMSPRAMHAFMTMADSLNPFVKIICPEETTDKYRCRVTAGPFKGIEGYFSRYEGIFVVLVDIMPFGYFKSCYIPRAHVELMEEVNINDKLVRMTLDTVTRITQHPKDPRMWFVLRCPTGCEVAVAECINRRQARALADRGLRTDFPLFYGEADDVGTLPVIAYCPVYGAVCRVPECIGQSLYPGHVLLYATKEDALRVTASTLRVETAGGTQSVSFCFEADATQEEVFTPMTVPYGSIIHLAHLIRNTTGLIDILKELRYGSRNRKR